MIQKLKLTNYRNFKEKLIVFSPKTTVIIGDNASGKTNILESLFLLSTGKSFHSHLEEEMIRNGQELARIKGKTEEATLEVVLTRGQIEVGDSKFEKTPRKKLLVNGVARRLIDFAGNFKVVLFGPWDMDLVTSSPSLRRNFLDTVLSQVDREYRRASLSYDKGVRQRNKLLYRIREEGLSRSQLLFWNQLLIKNGDYISQQRNTFVDFVNAGNLQLANSSFQLEYDKSIISEARLEHYKDEEIAAVSRRYGAGVLKRPPELSLDHVQSNEVFLFALRQLEKGNEFGDLPVPDFPRI